MVRLGRRGYLLAVLRREVMVGSRGLGRRECGDDDDDEVAKEGKPHVLRKTKGIVSGFYAIE